MCDKCKQYESALLRILRWDELSSEYSFQWGSRGERDYYRQIAKEALGIPK